jgi:hypothetical protein
VDVFILNALQKRGAGILVCRRAEGEIRKDVSIDKNVGLTGEVLQVHPTGPSNNDCS